MNKATKHKFSNRLKLLAIVALCALPPAGAYLLYVSGRYPGGTRNYGELVTPARPTPDVKLRTLAAKPKKFSALRGKWLLLYFGSAQCTTPCTRNLYKMRQVAAAQGTKEHRVRRVFVVTDAAAVDLLRYTLLDYPGTEALLGDPSEIAQLVEPFRHPAGSPLDGLHRIYIVDPLGNFVMSYPADADPTHIRKDMAHLLRVSQIG